MADSEARLRIVIDALNKSQAETKALLDDLKGIDKQTEKTKISLREFVSDSDKLKSVGNKLSVGVTLPLVGVATAATKLASDLNETRTKTAVIFGDMAGSIQQWADGANTNLGQTRKQALDAAGDFAIFGKSAGLAGQDLTAFSEKNVQLASDMASFFNTSPEEAITAIGAAFRGEAEPIRKYGVLLNDASLKDEALRQGLIKTTTEALTPQQRVLAAQALIFKQTSDAQGDFARTSDGLANQTRIMTAQFQDALATLGEKFLPIAIKGVGVVRDLLNAFQGLSPEMQNAIIVFGALAAAAGPVMRVGGTLIDVVGKIKLGMTALGASAAPLALVVAGLVAIVAYLDRVGKAARATNDDLIKMSHSGDFFDQAAASTEILTNGQNRLKTALDGVNAQLRISGKGYEDYRSSIEATAKAAGYQIDAEGNLIQVLYGMGGETIRLVQANYALAESDYAASRAAYSHGGIVDNAVNGLINLAREADKYNSALRLQKEALGKTQVQTQYTADALRDYALATQAGGQASKDFAKWLEDGVAAKMSNLNTIMAGAIKNENKQYIDQEETLAEQAAKIKEELDALTASQGRAITATSKATLTDAERAAIQGKLAVVTEDLALQQRKKNETDIEFASRMATNAATAEDLTGKLNGAATAVQGYVDNSKKIAELKGQYDDINAEIEANAAKHEDATNRILYGYLQQEIAAKVAEGKMTATEGFDAAMSAAIELGIVSAEDATAIGKMGSALDTALFTKDWKGLGTAIKEALNPPVVPPPVADYYANMYDASRKGYKAPEVDTTSIDVAQAKFDALSISTAARNFPIEFGPINKTLEDVVPKVNDSQIALDSLTGTPASQKVVPPMKEIITQVGLAKTLADGLRGSLDLIQSKQVTIKTKYVYDGEPPSSGTSSTTDSVPGRAQGGPTGKGGLFLLHPNEFVLSEAMRTGRAPIPNEALMVPTSGVSGTKIVNNNFYDSLATAMYLERERMEDLRAIEAVM